MRKTIVLVMCLSVLVSRGNIVKAGELTDLKKQLAEQAELLKRMEKKIHTLGEVEP